MSRIYRLIAQKPFVGGSHAEVISNSAFKMFLLSVSFFSSAAQYFLSCFPHFAEALNLLSTTFPPKPFPPRFPSIILTRPDIV